MAARIQRQATQTKNKQGWFAGNLVRWRYGLLEKVAGWQQLFSQTVAGIVRATSCLRGSAQQRKSSDSREMAAADLRRRDTL